MKKSRIGLKSLRSCDAKPINNNKINVKRALVQQAPVLIVTVSYFNCNGIILLNFTVVAKRHKD